MSGRAAPAQAWQPSAEDDCNSGAEETEETEVAFSIPAGKPNISRSPVLAKPLDTRVSWLKFDEAGDPTTQTSGSSSAVVRPFHSAESDSRRSRARSLFSKLSKASKPVQSNRSESPPDFVVIQGSKTVIRESSVRANFAAHLNEPVQRFLRSTDVFSVRSAEAGRRSDSKCKKQNTEVTNFVAEREETPNWSRVLSALQKKKKLLPCAYHSEAFDKFVLQPQDVLITEALLVNLLALSHVVVLDFRQVSAEQRLPTRPNLLLIKPDADTNVINRTVAPLVKRVRPSHLVCLHPPPMDIAKTPQFKQCKELAGQARMLFLATNALSAKTLNKAKLFYQTQWPVMLLRSQMWLLFKTQPHSTTSCEMVAELAKSLKVSVLMSDTLRGVANECGPFFQPASNWSESRTQVAATLEELVQFTMNEAGDLGKASILVVGNEDFVWYCCLATLMLLRGLVLADAYQHMRMVLLMRPEWIPEKAAWFVAALRELEMRLFPLGRGSSSMKKFWKARGKCVVDEELCMLERPIVTKKSATPCVDVENWQDYSGSSLHKLAQLRSNRKKQSSL